MKKITNLKDLLEIINKSTEGCVEGFIQLNGGLKSSKHISYNGEHLYILNLIDSSEDVLTLEEFKKSFLYDAMKKGAFFIQ